MSKAKRITERDHAILKFIGEHEAATSAQLARKFWAGRKERTAYERLDELKRAGYLESFSYHRDAVNSEISYKLTSRVQEILSPERASSAFYGKIAERELPEIIRGVETHLKLEEQGFKVLQWTSGRELLREQASIIAKNRHSRGWKMGKTSQRFAAESIADAEAIIEYEGATETVSIEIDGQYYGKMLAGKVTEFGKSDQRTIWATSSNRAGIVGRAISNESNQEVLEIE